jgi:hypothetical protein
VGLGGVDVAFQTAIRRRGGDVHPDRGIVRSVAGPAVRNLAIGFHEVPVVGMEEAEVRDPGAGPVPLHPVFADAVVALGAAGGIGEQVRCPSRDHPDVASFAEGEEPFVGFVRKVGASS